MWMEILFIIIGAVAIVHPILVYVKLIYYHFSPDLKIHREYLDNAVVLMNDELSQSKEDNECDNRGYA